ncbi:MAG: hypothetical protein RIF41_20840 [Polyangiaceae bacterium]
MDYMVSPRRVAVASIVSLSMMACTGTEPPPARNPEQPAAPEPVREAERPAPITIALPDLSEHASCKQARSAYVETWEIERGEGAADLTRGQFGMVLGRNTYFDHCGVPARYEVSICAAVQNGQVLGATVATKPRAPRLERCIDRGVRDLVFPAHPRMDVTETVFRR